MIQFWETNQFSVDFDIRLLISEILFLEQLLRNCPEMFNNFIKKKKDYHSNIHFNILFPVLLKCLIWYKNLSYPQMKQTGRIHSRIPFKLNKK